ncbi:MAG: hypothetical protein JRN16_06255 [Nitrososphaerota archaeon]|nr:hypothetical protein [Nitrososphaerota archaeon]MDG7027993.1 hypothetical protein [Nitrososphaerota archaeon]
MSLLVTALTFAHVFSAICYLGGAIVFGLVIGPQLPKLSPSVSNEFFAKIGPPFVRFTEVFAGMTILFGALLLGALVQGNFSLLSPSTTWGLSIIVGMTTGLLAFLIGLIWVTPASKRLIGYAQNLLSNPGPPPPEMLKAAGKLRSFSAAGLVLLVITVVFMVIAGTT